MLTSTQKRFLHMLPAESQLWSAWLSRYGQGWKNYRYDVHVGEGITVGPEYDIMTQGLAKALTQKRIDVVAERGNKVWIFEIKVQAALSALGQLLGYKTLYEKTQKDVREIRLAVVTDQVLPDDRYTFEAHGIKVYEMGDVF
jgi:hypothetical protein